jgi:hypothetical protein
MPRVAPKQGAFLHGCRDARCSVFREVATYKNIATDKFFELIDM